MSAIIINRLLAIVAFMALGICSCSDYLSEKPDQSLAVPNTLQDLQAILNYESYMIEGYPSRGAYGADYYYLTNATWESLNEYGRTVYLWDQAAAGLDMRYYDWARSYQRVFYCNVVLEQADEVSLGSLTRADRRYTKGSAHFFRGWSFYHLAQIFAPHYKPGNVAELSGIPIRLTSDINVPTVRASLSDTYEQILRDLKKAADLLPVNTTYPTQPSKPAAYGALAKVYLVMADYEMAAAYADSCLKHNPSLVDYNTLDLQAEISFEAFNEEVILHTTVNRLSSTALYPSMALVDSNLYRAYDDMDLRKYIFFQENEDSTFAFKGSYSGSNFLLFNGIATDEIYLIRAESYARTGKTAEALDDLNRLLEKRFANGTFTPVSGKNSEEVLKLILDERRKELAFRGAIRWSDLRRLNVDPRFAKSLQRRINDKNYQLPPGDSRYTFHIPWEVIELTGIPQNK